MKTKSFGAVLGSAILTVSVMTIGTATVDAAKATPPPGSGPSVGCSVQFYGITANFTGAGYDLHSTGTIVSTHSWLPQSRTIAISVPAGTYDVDAVGYDGSPTRATDAAQPHEQYKLEFLNAAGAVIGTTGITGDLADLVQEATWAGPVGTVALAEPATQVRAVHAFAGQVIPGSPNSVMPVCLGINAYVPPTTTLPPTTLPPTTLPPTTSSTLPPTTLPPTTLPPTTLPPTTSSTLPPTTLPPTTLPPTTLPPTTLPPETVPPTTAAPTTTTAAPTTTTTAAPTTTTTVAPTTTTTVKTQVLPAVEVAQPATPTEGNPAFTG